MAGFSVDTHLLRELGELLVGRDSTALVELIKNAYDADASRVIVEAVNLGAADAALRVIDDGSGMTRNRFESAFLRIAGRAKETDNRRSPVYGRRYTGQKGIGRLAAHKLAAWLAVTSIPRESDNARIGVKSTLDWDAIEQQQNLDDLTDGLHVEGIPLQPGMLHGTTLELRRLRAPWTGRQLATFVSELQSAQPPRAMTDVKWLAMDPGTEPLIREPKIRDVGSVNDPGFEVVLQGDLEIGESLWRRASEDFEWLVEIDALTNIVKYQITPLGQYAIKDPEAKVYHFQRKVPVEGRPCFQARILTMPNASTRRGPLQGFVRSTSGVRVYLEGFRVLPYGEYGDDWLGIDRDYRTGPRFYTIDIDPEESDRLEVDRKEGLQATANTGYYGAVFLTENGAGGLRSLVNREGFVPDASFDALVELVQAGIHLSVRVRRSVYLRAEERRRRRDQAEAEQRAAKSRPTTRPPDGQGEEKPPAGAGVPDVVGATEPSATSASDVGSQDMGSVDYGDSGSVEGYPSGASSVRPVDALQPDVLSVGAKQAISDAHDAVVALRASSALGANAKLVDSVAAGLDVLSLELDRLRQIQPELRILASVGLQLGAFVHDINGMLGQSRTIRELLEPLATDITLKQDQSRRIRRLMRALDDLSHALARQSSYLTDVLVADPRRRRSRIRVTERLDVVRRLLAEQAARLDVLIEDVLPEDLKTPPMFPAEVGVLLTNLLTNAVKNAGSPGVVRVTGNLLGRRGARICFHNTGVKVDLREAERWFLPFESTTTEVNEVLGQGLGLGLPITRALVEDYRGNIKFVDPPEGFATTIQVDLPDPQERS